MSEELQVNPQHVIQRLSQRLATLEVELASAFAVINQLMEDRANVNESGTSADSGAS